MKKLLLTLVLVIGLCSPALGQNATLDCHGTQSGGDGFVDCNANPRAYAYKLTAGTYTISYVEIGTEDGNPANYTNVCVPDGWTWNIYSSARNHYTGKTPHGNVSPGPNGTCPFVIAFEDDGGGPIAAGATFNFGFDHSWEAHDVGWDVNEGADNEDWAMPVGMGEGPVHGPHKSPFEGPTLSQWGLIILLIVMAGIATWVVLKRRRVVTA